jgi:hypothetical protein
MFWMNSSVQLPLCPVGKVFDQRMEEEMGYHEGQYKPKSYLSGCTHGGAVSRISQVVWDHDVYKVLVVKSTRQQGRIEIYQCPEKG